MVRCYSEMILLPTYEERLEYLKIDGVIGDATFGYDRYLNQNFYKSPIWKRFRNDIIVRDNGCDLGIDGYTIYGRVTIHHINPISKEDILAQSSSLLDPENVICVSDETHKAIHYGTAPKMFSFVERLPNDTCPWKR